MEERASFCNEDPASGTERGKSSCGEGLKYRLSVEICNISETSSADEGTRGLSDRPGESLFPYPEKTRNKETSRATKIVQRKERIRTSDSTRHARFLIEKEYSQSRSCHLYPKEWATLLSASILCKSGGLFDFDSNLLSQIYFQARSSRKVCRCSYDSGGLEGCHC